MTYKELSRSNDLEDASWPRENERLICHISRFEDYKFDPLDFDVVGIPLGCVWKFVQVLDWDFGIIRKSGVGTVIKNQYFNPISLILQENYCF